MSSAYTEAIQEAFATARSDIAIIDTLEIRHDSIANPIYICRALEELDLTLEDSSTKTFLPTGFAIELPEKSNEGLQELNIQIDNVNLEVSRFIEEAMTYQNSSIKLIYRPYMSNDLTQPQMDPPLVLYLKKVSIDNFTVRGTATFADILNLPFLSERYTSTRFPAL